MTTERPSSLPHWLTVAGLVPFVGLSLSTIFLGNISDMGDWRDLSATALLLYAALIVSFLGGLRWGIALKAEPVDASSIILSVLPSLLAWPLVLLGLAGMSGIALALSAGLIVLVYIWDRAAFKSGQLPSWFAPTRTLATLVAALSLILAAPFA
ncbi:MAG: DUF3429 domain-containing protein [Pseudomonadota bacterium]